MSYAAKEVIYHFGVPFVILERLCGTRCVFTKQSVDQIHVIWAHCELLLLRHFVLMYHCGIKLPPSSHTSQVITDTATFPLPLLVCTFLVYILCSDKVGHIGHDSCQYCQASPSMWKTNLRIKVHTKVCEIWGSHSGVPKVEVVQEAFFNWLMLQTKTIQLIYTLCNIY